MLGLVVLAQDWSLKRRLEWESTVSYSHLHRVEHEAQRSSATEERKHLAQEQAAPEGET